MPASRRVIASSSRATPSQEAPPSTAARPDGTIPWPYPSALTTAMSPAPVAWARRSPTLWRIAARSTRTAVVTLIGLVWQRLTSARTIGVPSGGGRAERPRDRLDDVVGADRRLCVETTGAARGVGT